MTLSDLAKKATGKDDEVIPLSNGEARDIVEIVIEADTRRESLIERNAELEAQNAQLTARVAELVAQAEDTRIKLAAALRVVTAATAS
jgi:hypothetical protein